ncbi:hypothetical protein L7F22_015073 [Adiantum nelumboides]|nr:hypothetical protein [Adiantum nelumboides]
MQAIHNNTCLELPPLRSRNECGFKEVASICYKDAALPANLRLDQKDCAFMFPLRLEATGRSSEWQNPIQELEAVQRPVRQLLAPIAHTESFLVLLEDCITKNNVAIGRNLHMFIAENGLELDSFFCSHLILLKACAMSAALADGEQTHAHVLEHGLESDVFVSSSLISMYSYVHHGHGQEALGLFHKMRVGGFVPDKITFLSAVKACSRISVLEIGYAQCGFGREALQIFQEMLEKGITPNTVTFVCVVNACARISAFEQGKKVHAYIAECGFAVDLSLGIALVDMYAKCGSLLDAGAMLNSSLMQSSVAWNALIGGCTDCGHNEEALRLFQQMLQQGVVPDQVSFACILKACTTLEQCKRVHSCIIDSFELDPCTGNILIDMYAKLGRLDSAKLVFSRLPDKNVVTWSTLIVGYVEHGLGQEALGLFQQMEQEGIKPNHVTFLGILKACSSMAALDHGKAIQATIVDNGLEFNVLIASALMDMYAKCGKQEDVHILFDRLPSRDDVVWGTLIGAHAHYNDYKGTLKYFKAMLQAGLKPDEVTFLCLLSACCHAGMLDEGCAHFKSMPEIYGMWPDLEHYDCLVDLFSFAGRFDAAEDLLETIHHNCNVVGWKAMLTACRRHGNVSLGRRCFEQVVKCEPGNASLFVLMSSTYTRTGLWEEGMRLEVARRHANAWKVPAKACIEVENEIHSFTVGDTTHPFSEKIQLKLKSITASLLEEGYAPQYDLIPSDLSIDCKQDALCGHSERLAIAFGLLSTPQEVEQPPVKGRKWQQIGGTLGWALPGIEQPGENREEAHHESKKYPPRRNKQ